ncbi:uncharacterized protein LOC141905254 [Tubulanus polymorphus]|uniref:uncharacterized protein LOC141905254 n=1 Tax=Tubulanus polymorphus TaxID=672921 RepID=UPI003DA2BC9F
MTRTIFDQFSRDYWRLGCGKDTSSAEPIRIQLYEVQPKPPEIRGVSCGGRHTFIWLENGHVFSFGNDSFGQLGYNQNMAPTVIQMKPRLLRHLSNQVVEQVSCGERHSLLMLRGGSVSAVGHNTYGQLGIEPVQVEMSRQPITVKSLPQISRIASGANHNIAIDDSGDVYVWGYGLPCGNKQHNVISPIKITLSRAIAVSGGNTHSLALIDDGSVYSWGAGVDGQMGHGQKVRFLKYPRKISSIVGPVVSVDCGDYYSAVLTVSGDLYLWGKNSHVISPVMTSSDRIYQPHRVDLAGGLPVKSISCGSWHVAAITGKPCWLSSVRDSGETTVNDELIDEDVGLSSDFDSDDEDEEVENCKEIVDYPVIKREKTSISLAEFYAPTPQPTDRTGMVFSPDVMQREASPGTARCDSPKLSDPVSHEEELITSNWQTPVENDKLEDPITDNDDTNCTGEENTNDDEQCPITDSKNSAASATVTSDIPYSLNRRKNSITAISRTKSRSKSRQEKFSVSTRDIESPYCSVNSIGFVPVDALNTRPSLTPVVRVDHSQPEDSTAPRVVSSMLKPGRILKLQRHNTWAAPNNMSGETNNFYNRMLLEHQKQASKYTSWNYDLPETSYKKHYPQRALVPARQQQPSRQTIKPVGMLRSKTTMVDNKGRPPPLRSPIQYFTSAKINNKKEKRKDDLLIDFSVFSHHTMLDQRGPCMSSDTRGPGMSSDTRGPCMSYDINSKNTRKTNKDDSLDSFSRRIRHHSRPRLLGRCSDTESSRIITNLLPTTRVNNSHSIHKPVVKVFSKK